MATLTCTPSELLDTYPCLACLSESELKAVIALSLADTLGLTVAEMLEDTACFNCLSKKQLLQVIATRIGSEFLGRYTVAEIRDQIKCLLCAPTGKVDAAFGYLVCAYLNSLQPD